MKIHLSCAQILNSPTETSVGIKKKRVAWIANFTISQEYNMHRYWFYTQFVFLHTVRFAWIANFTFAPQE